MMRNRGIDRNGSLINSTLVERWEWIPEGDPATILNPCEYFTDLDMGENVMDKFTADQIGKNVTYCGYCPSLSYKAYLSLSRNTKNVVLGYKWVISLINDFVTRCIYTRVMFESRQRLLVTDPRPASRQNVSQSAFSSLCCPGTRHHRHLYIS